MLRSLLCTALALCFAPALWAEQFYQVWAPGVSEEGGWYDYNKTTLNEGYRADTGMCWAYSASNVIAWWQNHNADTLTANGITAPQNEQIVNTFVGVYKNIGFWPSAAYEWWIKGTGDLVTGNVNEYGSSNYVDWETIEPKDKDTSAVEKELGLTGFNINTLANGGILKNAYKDLPLIIFGVYYNNNPFDFAEAIIQAIKDGYALSLSVDQAHAYTLWGVEYKEMDQGLMITKAWITDSDDLNNTGSGLVPKEVAYQVKEGTPGLCFAENAGAVWANLAGIRTTQIMPEPSTSILTLMALAGLALRRRRS